MYTHVLFDLDGTLTDSSGCVAACAAAAMERHGFAAPEASRVISLMGVPLERVFGMLDPRAGEASVSAALVATYREEYARRAPGAVRAFAGVAELLAGLAGRGVRSAVVTSKHSRPAEADCAGVGIRGSIAVLVGSDHVSRHKPDPEPALHAMRLLGTAPGPHVVVVGDSVFDLEMGRAAGVRTCGVTWGAHGRERLLGAGPDHLAGSVGELARVLGEVRGV